METDGNERRNDFVGQLEPETENAERQWRLDERQIVRVEFTQGAGDGKRRKAMETSPAQKVLRTSHTLEPETENAERQWRLHALI